MLFRSICTLPIPCKHCKTKEDLKIAEERSASAHPRTEVWSDTSSINRYGVGERSETLSVKPLKREHNLYEISSSVQGDNVLFCIRIGVWEDCL